jgi:hypothetical protein
MTMLSRDDVIRMAREAGFGEKYPWEALTMFERFAQLVAAQAAAEERDACAKVCEAEHLEDPQDGEDDAYDCAVNDCVRAIRARGTA